MVDTGKCQRQINVTPTANLRLVLICILCLTLLLSSVLLFARLGHYALWDDEAMDALSARAILKTGDTTAMVGDNIVAYRNGLLLHNFRQEGMPPFTAYVAAASMYLLGENALAARLPMAVFGLACVALMLWWLWLSRPSLTTALIFAIALLGNVSFFLYARQCHYYGAAMFFYVLIAFAYLHGDGRRSMLALIGVSSALLMAANPSFFVALGACLLADYLIWQRKVRALAVRDLVVLLMPPLVMGIVLLIWWNPLRTPLGGYLVSNSLEQRLMLFLWNWRDLNRGEMLAGLLLVMAVWAVFKYRDVWLQRALLALGVYVGVISILSTQLLGGAAVADARYLSAILPLCIAIGALTLRAVAPRTGWLIIPLACLAFGTNLLTGGPLLYGKTHIAIAQFAGELLQPPGDPFTVASRWIKENTQPHESVLVVPGEMTYPLMFHAPAALYAWQLPWPPAPQFKGLPMIHFQGTIPPDYIVVFGSEIKKVEAVLAASKHARYEQVAVLDHFWKDMHRPELFWHSFVPILYYDREKEGIYVFRLVSDSMR